MTNFQSTLGGMAWAAVAALLMLAALEPVSIAAPQIELAASDAGNANG